jgi:hypothetical protein
MAHSSERDGDRTNGKEAFARAEAALSGRSSSFDQRLAAAKAEGYVIGRRRGLNDAQAQVKQAFDNGSAEGYREGQALAANICEEQAVRLAARDDRGLIWKDGEAMASGARHCAIYIRNDGGHAAIERLKAEGARELAQAILDVPRMDQVGPGAWTSRSFGAYATEVRLKAEEAIDRARGDKDGG